MLGRRPTAPAREALLVNCERNKQDVRDTKFWFRSSENLELSPVSLVPLFSQVSRVSRE